MARGKKGCLGPSRASLNLTRDGLLLPWLKERLQRSKQVADTGVIGSMAVEAIRTGAEHVAGSLLVSFHRGVFQLTGADLIASWEYCGGSDSSRGPSGSGHDVVVAYVRAIQKAADIVVYRDDLAVRGSGSGVERVRTRVECSTPRLPPDCIARRVVKG